MKWIYIIAFCQWALINGSPKQKPTMFYYHDRAEALDIVDNKHKLIDTFDCFVFDSIPVVDSVAPIKQAGFELPKD